MTKNPSPLPPRNNRLRQQREKSRLTQKEVAKLLDVDFTTVSKHESGTRGLTSAEIAKYAALYKVQSHELFIGDFPKTNTLES